MPTFKASHLASDIDQLESNLSALHTTKPKQIQVISDPDVYATQLLSDEHQAGILEGIISKQTQHTTNTNQEILPPAPKSGSRFDQLSHQLNNDHNIYNIPYILQGIDFKQIKNRADLIYAISHNIPLNEYDFPQYIFRSDILNYQDFVEAFTDQTTETTETTETTTIQTQDSVESIQEQLDTAIIHLDYLEGFPRLPSGEPLWAQFPFEPKEAFSAFLEYCELPGVRLTSKLTSYPQNLIKSWYNEYYWQTRSKTFDLMHAIHRQKLREQRMLSCEDDHFKESQKLFNRLTALSESVEWDYLLSDPKQFVDVLEKVVKLQRLSIGLALTAQPQSSKVPNNQTTLITESVEMTLKRAAEARQSPETTQQRDSLNVRDLLSNPEALATAQELVIRMTQTTQQTTPQTPQTTNDQNSDHEA